MLRSAAAAGRLRVIRKMFSLIRIINLKLVLELVQNVFNIGNMVRNDFGH